jgi:hypothetical protein
MRYFIYKTTFIALVFVGLVSCEKKVDIDLNDANPKLVIEGTLYGGTNLFTVNITQTASYFNSESIPTITNASVILKDQSGTFNIPHVGNGVYQLMFTGVSNNTYTLEVIWEGNLYSASSYLPQVVPIIELRAEESTGGVGPGSGHGGGSSLPQYKLYCAFDDPIGVENFYRFRYDVNGVPDDITEFQIISDKNSDGQYIDIPIRFGQKTFSQGDSVDVHLVSFDEAAYDYYLTLSSIVSSGGGPMSGSAAPGNPTNNWSGDILGHFFALNIDTMNIIIQ